MEIRLDRLDGSLAPRRTTLTAAIDRQDCRTLNHLLAAIQGA